MKMLKETMNELENLINLEVKEVGIRGAQEKASFVLLLIQNTSGEMLDEEFDYESSGPREANMVAKEMLNDVAKYETLFHEGWDFRDIVEAAVIKEDIILI